MTDPTEHDERANDEELPEFHSSALRTGVFRVLTGVCSLLMGWALWSSFSWGYLFLVSILLYFFTPFTLMGYESQRFFDSVNTSVRRIVYFGVPEDTLEAEPSEPTDDKKNNAKQQNDG